ncbi:MAG: gliding motility-associated C-terminal domain-containing protein [Bacteroidetes bacterium]|nr:gliding motility-associated C-terminal domain-containing protein [Bacteroidota bacterium]
MNASNSSGIGTLSFIWKDSMGQMIGIDSMLSVTQSGVYTMDVIDEDNGCAASTSVLVDQNITLPDADAGADGVITCAQDFYTLNAINSSQGSSFQQEWFDGNGMKLGNGLTFDANQIGVYSLVVTNIVNGCTAESFVEVFEDKNAPTALAEASGLLTCTVQEITVDGSNSSGVGTFTFEWFDPAGNSIGTDVDINVENTGVYQLVVTDDSNECTDSGTISVEENITPPSTVIANADLFDCSTTAIVLDGSGSSVGPNFISHWTTLNGDINNGTNTLNPQIGQPGIYTLEITNTDNGCTTTEDVIVEADDDISEANIVTTDPLCFGDLGNVIVEEVFGGTPPFVYSIDDQAFTSASTFSQLDPEDYIVTIEDVNGCVFYKDVTIAPVFELTIALPRSVTIELGDDFEIQTHLNHPLSDIASIVWEPENSLSCTDCLSLYANPIQTTQYTLTVTTVNGCQATASIWINVEKQRNVFIPNAFTPNDDGSNDIFYIFASKKMVKQVNTFRIFTRWGDLVFEASNFYPNDSAHGWNGIFNGTKMNPGVFVYYAEIEFIDGVTKLYKGDVMLSK